MCTPTTKPNVRRSNTHMPQISKIYENFIFIRFCAYWSKPMAPNYVLLLHAAATEHIYEHIVKRWRVQRGAYIFHKVAKFTVESFQIIATPTSFSSVFVGKISGCWFILLGLSVLHVVFLFGWLIHIIYTMYTKNMWIFFCSRGMVYSTLIRSWIYLNIYMKACIVWWIFVWFVKASS